MKKNFLMLVAWMTLAVIVSSARVWAQPAGAPAPVISIRNVDMQVVIYTIHRGPYDTAGAAVPGLIAIAVQKGMIAIGPPSFAYLNNPQLVSKEHWLTEVRLPVKAEAMKLAGTLGEFTDVKKLPAMELVTITKAAGQADPGPLYELLADWVVQKGYSVVDGPCETFLKGAEAGDYAKMQTEIAMPVQKAARPPQ